MDKIPTTKTGTISVIIDGIEVASINMQVTNNTGALPDWLHGIVKVEGDTEVAMEVRNLLCLATAKGELKREPLRRPS